MGKDVFESKKRDDEPKKKDDQWEKAAERARELRKGQDLGLTIQVRTCRL